MSEPVGIENDPRSANTFPQLIRAAAAAYGDDVAITLEGETIPDESLTFRELDRKSAELARGMVARGVGKGTRIGYIYGNGPSFALLLAAISRIGAVAIPITTLAKSDELVRILRQSDIAGLFVQRTFLGRDYVDRLCEALPELGESPGPDVRIARAPFLRWIVSTGDALPAAVQDIGTFAGAADSVSEELLAAMEAEVHSTDQMIEIYTSGSMALPKGVKHNHGPALFRTHYMTSMLGLQRGQQLRASMPMFWVGGLMMSLLPNWEAGATTVCTERTLNNSRFSMGSVLAEEDMALYAQSRPYWGLGMSETLGPYSYGDEFRAPGYPVCAPLDHFADRYEVRLADEEGRPVPQGATGEIQVRGYALTPGLHKMERSQHFTPDGFYRTGDLGFAEGKRIHFIGRDGDMVKTASANVSPAEVEMEMQALEGVHSAYVVGVPDGEKGQLLVAAVVPREGTELDFDEIQSTLSKRLSGYKVPRVYVAITREDVPLLASNKVARRQIEKMMADKLGRDR